MKGPGVGARGWRWSQTGTGSGAGSGIDRGDGDLMYFGDEGLEIRDSGGGTGRISSTHL